MGHLMLQRMFVGISVFLMVFWNITEGHAGDVVLKTESGTIKPDASKSWVLSSENCLRTPPVPGGDIRFFFDSNASGTFAIGAQSDAPAFGEAWLICEHQSDIKVHELAIQIGGANLTVSDASGGSGNGGWFLYLFDEMPAEAKEFSKIFNDKGRFPRDFELANRWKYLERGEGLQTISRHFPPGRGKTKYVIAIMFRDIWKDTALTGKIGWVRVTEDGVK